MDVRGQLIVFFIYISFMISHVEPIFIHLDLLLQLRKLKEAFSSDVTC